MLGRERRITTNRPVHLAAALQAHHAPHAPHAPHAQTGCPDVATIDGDGLLTLFDFLAFQNAFQDGCP